MGNIEDEARAEGTRIAERDKALARLDESEVKARMIAALDRFIQIGFAVHLVGVKVRGAIEYTLALYPDGTEAIPSSDLQAAADEFRLDYQIQAGEPSVDGWAIVLYPRW